MIWLATAAASAQYESTTNLNNFQILIIIILNPY